MKTLYDSYAAFCSLLDDPANLSLSYEELCARIHVSPLDLSEILREELGFSGMELVASLQPPVRV